MFWNIKYDKIRNINYTLEKKEMAKHKDIDRTSALLSGTSWHVDESHENQWQSNRRDKRYTICVSSSECGCYREK